MDGPIAISTCPLCDELVDLDDTDTIPVGTSEGTRQAHRECMLRCVLGGIGHLTDHSYWCLKMHDPDAGLTYRQSALRCDTWVRQRAV